MHWNKSHRFFLRQLFRERFLGYVASLLGFDDVRFKKTTALLLPLDLGAEKNVRTLSKVENLGHSHSKGEFMIRIWLHTTLRMLTASLKMRAALHNNA